MIAQLIKILSESPKKSKHFYILIVNPLKEVESNGK